MSPRVIVLTGSTSGIGFALVKLLASEPESIIYAGVRSLSRADLKPEFLEVVKKAEGRVRLLKLEAADEEGNRAAAAQVEKDEGYVDIVIANAGIGYNVDLVENVPVKEFKDHFNVNVLGPLALYQSFASLLSKKEGSKYIAMSSEVCSITLISSFPSIIPAYSTSRAALSMLVRIIHSQSSPSGLCAFPLHPGVVDTPLCRRLVNEPNVDPGMKEELEKVMITPEESAKKVLKVLQEAKRETHGGKFVSAVGAEFPW